MKRKVFVVFLLTLLAIFTSSTALASESENNESNLIKLTEGSAISIAESFASGIVDDELEATDTVKIFDQSGQAIGYSIDFYQADGSYAGYVILDSTVEGLVSEYSIGENIAENPLSSAAFGCDTESKAVSHLAQAEESLTFYKLSPTEYGVLDDTYSVTTNYGERKGVHEVGITNSSRFARSPIGSWNDVFVPESTVIYDCTSVESAVISWPWNQITQSTAERYAKKYACGVSAMYTAGSHYGAVDGNYGTLSNDYGRLWDISGTTTYTNPDGTPGVSYGTTPYTNLGQALVSFCAEKGVSISSSTATWPVYESFKSSVNQDNASLWGGSYGLTVNSGHIMAVIGYNTLQYNDGSGTINTLSVSDGWKLGLRSFNFNNFYPISYGIFYYG